VPVDPIYLSVLISAEKKSWRCTQSGETPQLINAKPHQPRIEAASKSGVANGTGARKVAGVAAAPRYLLILL
jgi:hypothetical protein